MYGTIAKVNINPEKEESEALAKRFDLAPGPVARYVFGVDANLHEFYLEVRT